MTPATKVIYDKFKLLHDLAVGAKTELLLGVTKIPNETKEDAHARFWRHFAAMETLADQMAAKLEAVKERIGESRGH